METLGSRAVLLERIRRASPRVVTLVAEPGWGKSFVGKALAASARAGVYLNFIEVDTAQRARAELAAALDGASWELADSDLVVIDGANELIRLDASFVEGLLARLPQRRILVLSSESEIVIPIAKYFAPHEILALHREDLELDRDTARELIAQDYMETDLLERAIETANGWPVAVLLFGRLAREGRLAEALDDLSSPMLADLHRYILERLSPRYSDEERSVLVATAALERCTKRELCAAVGFDAAMTIASLEQRRLKTFRCIDGYYSVQPLMRGAAWAIYRERCCALLVTAAATLFEQGHTTRAAWFASEANDLERAAAYLDAAGRRTAGEPVSEEYNQIALRLPLELIFASKHIFLEFFCNRRTRVRPYALSERVQTFCERLTPDVDPVVRLSARLGLMVLYRMTNRGGEALALGRDCEKSLAEFPEATDRRDLLRSEFAILAAFGGRVLDAQAIWETFERDDPLGRAWFAFSHFETMWPIELHLGNAHAVDLLTERNIEYARLWGDPAILAQAYSVQVVTQATLGTFAGSQKMAKKIADIAATLPSKGDRVTMMRALASPYESDDPPTNAACLLAIEAAFGQTDRAVAERLVRASMAGFDRMGYPYWQIVGRLSATQLPGMDRAALLAQCSAIAQTMQVPAIDRQLRALAESRTLEGPFSGFLKLVQSSSLLERTTVFRIRLLDAKVSRSGVDVRVRHREFELLAHLALAGGPVNAGTLCEEMWPKSDPHAATSALRMSVHRLRKQLDDSQAVLSVPGGYELGPHLAVDLLEAESAFAAIRRLTTLEKADHTSLRALFDYIRSAAQTTNVNESWYEKIGYRVDELRHGTGLLLAREYLKRSEPLRALEIGEELLRIDDKDESAVAVCVQSFDAVGDKAAGLRLWQQYVKRLAADYGAKPSIGLDELTAVPR